MFKLVIDATDEVIGTFDFAEFEHNELTLWLKADEGDTNDMATEWCTLYSDRAGATVIAFAVASHTRRKVEGRVSIIPA